MAAYHVMLHLYLFKKKYAEILIKRFYKEFWFQVIVKITISFIQWKKKWRNTASVPYFQLYSNFLQLRNWTQSRMPKADENVLLINLRLDSVWIFNMIFSHVQGTCYVLQHCIDSTGTLLIYFAWEISDFLIPGRVLTSVICILSFLTETHTS